MLIPRTQMVVFGLLLLLLYASAASAASSCPSVDSAWAQYTATGTLVPYGYTVQGLLQVSKNAPATSVSSVGTIKFLSSNFLPSGDGSTITGFVIGVEKQNLGGVVSTFTFGGDTNSTFVFHTADCSGTITRQLNNGSVVVWQVVLVDGGDTIRYIDTRANPAIQPGVLQLMK